MRTKDQFISFEQILSSLRGLQFDVEELPGVANQIFARKYGVGAILARQTGAAHLPKTVPLHSALWIHHPGLLVCGQVATLLDRGYQKFWRIKGLEVPATADSLRAVHRFEEELREAIGEPSLYNESLGTTSDVYLYDRLQGREAPAKSGGGH